MGDEGWLPRRALTKACAPPGWGALAGRRALNGDGDGRHHMMLAVPSVKCLA